MSYSSYLHNIGYGHKNTKNQGWNLTGFTECLHETVSSVRSRLHEEGFTIRQEEDATYAINFKQHIIINLTEELFKKLYLKQLELQKYQQKIKIHTYFSEKVKLRNVNGGSYSERREWEVGQRKNYDDIDDGHSIKR